MKKTVIFLTVLVLMCALGAPVFATDGDGGGNIGTLILIGCIGGAVAAISTAVGVICSYRRKSRSAQYPLDRYASMKLTNRADIFLSRHVTRTKISSNKSRK